MGNNFLVRPIVVEPKIGVKLSEWSTCQNGVHCRNGVHVEMGNMYPIQHKVFGFLLVEKKIVEKVKSMNGQSTMHG